MTGWACVHSMNSWKFSHPLKPIPKDCWNITSRTGVDPTERPCKASTTHFICSRFIVAFPGQKQNQFIQQHNDSSVIGWKFRLTQVGPQRNLVKLMDRQESDLKGPPSSKVFRRIHPVVKLVNSSWTVQIPKRICHQNHPCRIILIFACSKQLIHCDNKPCGTKKIWTTTIKYTKFEKTDSLLIYDRQYSYSISSALISCDPSTSMSKNCA